MLASFIPGFERVRFRPLFWGAAAAALVFCSVGCAAVYPEIKTPVKDAVADRTYEPAPPDELLYITLIGADIPDKTRGGQKWDEVGGNAPDPFMKVYLNDELLFVTPLQSNSLKPTWPNQERRNYYVPFESVLRFELWDDNPINDQPICIRKLQDVHDVALEGETVLRCDSGAILKVEIKHAQPKIGLGFNYEIRGSGVAVTKVLERSPAERAGLKRWDQIVTLMDEDTDGMSASRVKSLVNANAPVGVRMKIQHQDGKKEELVLKQGPIYFMYTPVGERSDDKLR